MRVKPDKLVIVLKISAVKKSQDHRDRDGRMSRSNVKIIIENSYFKDNLLLLFGFRRKNGSLNYVCCTMENLAHTKIRGKSFLCSVINLIHGISKLFHFSDSRKGSNMDS